MDNAMHKAKLQELITELLASPDPDPIEGTDVEAAQIDGRAILFEGITALNQILEEHAQLPGLIQASTEQQTELEQLRAGVNEVEQQRQANQNRAAQLSQLGQSQNEREQGYAELMQKSIEIRNIATQRAEEIASLKARIAELETKVATLAEIAVAVEAANPEPGDWENPG
jgi:hypothetical protein